MSDDDWEKRTIPLNKANPSQARLFISGALSGAAKILERSLDAAPSQKEFDELSKLLYKLELAAAEYWTRGQLKVIDGSHKR